MPVISEKRLLQAVIVLACGVPIVGGGVGVLRGLSMIGLSPATIGADSHFRYLSGLLLGIGCGFLSAVPRIAARGARVRLLAAIVVTGGFGRLLAVAVGGTPDPSTLLALMMELAVTPLLVLWQARVASSARGAADHSR